MTVERQKNLDDFGGNLFSLKSYDNMSKNIKFLPKLKKAIYQRLPNVNDLEKNSRLNPVMYELFKMNAGTNRRR